MPFNVANFASNIGTYGTLQTNKFEVNITLPSFATAPEQTLFRERLAILPKRIDSFKMPGLAIDTYETRRYGVGPTINAATNIRFEPFSLSVITDKDYDLYRLFYGWLNRIFDFGSGSPTYLTNYKKGNDGYATSVQVKVYESTGQLKATYNFFDAFPVGLTEPALSWRDNNTLHKFDVTFDYTNWEVIRPATP